MTSDQAEVEPNEPQKEEGIRVSVILDTPPFLRLGEVRLSAVPRPGDNIIPNVDGRAVSATVSWVTWLPNDPVTAQIAIKFGEPQSDAPPAETTSSDFEKTLARITEVNTRIYEKTASHNNVMMVAGYAGMFAIWGFVKTYLSQAASLWVGSLMGVSIMLFVVFELISMYLRSRPFLAYAKLPKSSSEEYAAALPKFSDDMNKHTAKAAAVWAVLFYPTVITGFVAALLLIINMFWLLSGSTSWPS